MDIFIANDIKKFMNVASDLGDFFTRVDGTDDMLKLYIDSPWCESCGSLLVKFNGDRKITIMTDEKFSMYLEKRYGACAVKHVVDRVISRHGGDVLRFDTDQWRVEGECQLHLYPYLKWAIVDVVEDICGDVL